MGDFKVKSSAFNHEEKIPSKHSCDGIDVSPRLKWQTPPENTESFVLIFDDPDAPMGTWDHWILFNIPSGVTELDENFLVKNSDIDEIKAGKNDFGKLEYGGPCPPGGTHRYFFKLYAIDTYLDIPEGVKKDKVLEAIEGHIIDKTELMGKYSR